MYAVAAADADCVLVLEGAFLERFEQLVHVGDQDVRSPNQLDVECRVEHVGRRHALMDEAAIRADEFGKMRQKGDDVMLCDGFNLVDPSDIELG